MSNYEQGIMAAPAGAAVAKAFGLSIAGVPPELVGAVGGYLIARYTLVSNGAVKDQKVLAAAGAAGIGYLVAPYVQQSPMVGALVGAVAGYYYAFKAN